MEGQKVDLFSTSYFEFNSSSNCFWCFANVWETISGKAIDASE